jgi:putative tryptophan/tyrosine transport system substrate-binding protein
MRRRQFIALLSGAAAAWPLSAQAQQGRMRRIGVLMAYADTDLEAKKWIAAFDRRIAELGWKAGSNVTIEYRWAGEAHELIRAAAAELVGLRLEVMLASNTPATGALLQATPTIPIVFVNVADPIGSGFIANLPRPGGNVTGFIPIEVPLGAKWISLLKETVPRISSVAFMHNPQTAPYAGEFIRHAETAAALNGWRFIAVPVHDADGIDSIIALAAREANGSLIVLSSAFTTAHRGRIIAAAAQHRLPAIYGFRYFAADGGLMSYGSDMNQMFSNAASYVDRILKGERPGDLPAQTPTKFEWVINLKTAKAIGIEVPNSALLLADETIE